ncbi:MAG: hypothetical protein AAF614_01520 [Chloroflexota bacterium]
MTFDYKAPVDKLLRISEITGDYRHATWPDYVARYKLVPEHVPELIRVVQDLETFWNLPTEDAPAALAPYHAVRALGQLGQPTAIEPLMALLLDIYAVWDGDDYLSEEIPQAIGLMGSAALEPIRQFLADGKNGTWPRMFMSSALEVIAEQDPALRETCAAIIASVLINFQSLPIDLTSSLISTLVDLKGVEHASLIEAAFAADCVDLMVRGDWEDIQIDLGLLDKRITPPPNLRLVKTPRSPKQSFETLVKKANRRKRHFQGQATKKKKAKQKKRKKRKR